MQKPSMPFARVSVAALCAIGLAGCGGSGPGPSEEAQNAGVVVSVEPLPQKLWVPGSVESQKFTYWSTGSDGKPAQSSGTYHLPPGDAPEGGWPVIAWAHGTSGLDDSCAPSLVGPLIPQRDDPFLARWLHEGYAVVATDYVGLGTPGLMPYLDGKVEAHSVVDSVKAARKITDTLSNRWAVVGQSQGGHAAVVTARYATEYGGEELDYRGAVGTGVPADIEIDMLAIVPGFPPETTPVSAMSYILAGLREARPKVDWNSS